MRIRIDMLNGVNGLARFHEQQASIRKTLILPTRTPTLETVQDEAWPIVPSHRSGTPRDVRSLSTTVTTPPPSKHTDAGIRSAFGSGKLPAKRPLQDPAPAPRRQASRPSRSAKPDANDAVANEAPPQTTQRVDAASVAGRSAQCLVLYGISSLRIGDTMPRLIVFPGEDMHNLKDATCTWFDVPEFKGTMFASLNSAGEALRNQNNSGKRKTLNAFISFTLCPVTKTKIQEQRIGEGFARHLTSLPTE